MTEGPILVRPHSSYQHEALLYRGVDAFLAGTVGFVRDGLPASSRSWSSSPNLGSVSSERRSAVTPGGSE